VCVRACVRVCARVCVCMCVHVATPAGCLLPCLEDIGRPHELAPLQNGIRLREYHSVHRPTGHEVY
jgi:hypothetical protein